MHAMGLPSPWCWPMGCEACDACQMDPLVAAGDLSIGANVLDHQRNIRAAMWCSYLCVASLQSGMDRSSQGDLYAVARDRTPSPRLRPTSPVQMRRGCSDFVSSRSRRVPQHQKREFFRTVRRDGFAIPQRQREAHRPLECSCLVATMA